MLTAGRLAFSVHLRFWRTQRTSVNYQTLQGLPALLPRPARPFEANVLRPLSLRSARLLCHSAARPQVAMGLQKRRAATAQPKQKPMEAPSLLPVTLTDECIHIRGSTVLGNLSAQAWVSHADNDMLVLGMKSADGATSMADFALGTLHCRRWLCCARNKLWWMTPEWGTTANELPPETQFLLMELDDGSYTIMLPLIDDDTFRGTLRPPPSKKNGQYDPTNTVFFRMESGDEAVLGQRWSHALLIAAGTDPFALVDAAVAKAASLSGAAKPLREKRLPASLEVFGWCSWDAFYSSVSAQGLTDAVQSLKAGGVPPRLVIIDDGWQITDLDAQFKGWQDPPNPLKPATSRDHTQEDRPRGVYIEGESEMLSAVLRDVPAGSATGVLLQEVKAADDQTLESVDYYTLAKQHDAAGFASLEDEMAAQRIRDVRTGKGRRRHRYALVRLTGTVVQYATGLIVGAFQALVLLFYQWIVDPAADGTWPVRFFASLASGPLRTSMLQFYADQTNFTRRLTDVRANAKFHSPDTTPEAVHSPKTENLSSVVAHLKDNLAVQYVYCWHGLSAYWSGVSATSPAMQKYNPRLVFAKPPAGLREIEPSMLWNPSVLAGVGAVYDPSGLFNDMHSYLAAAGVTGVKVDCQAGVGMVGSVTGGGPAVAARYHAALEDSVSKHFPQNDAINCMAHSTENIYRWRDTAVARASDDFYPTDTASHLPHIASCAYNGLFLSALAQPDFDMFHSRHAAAEVHAAARAVSGGPVYVSDAPGAHGFDLLKKLVLPDGSILRAALPGRPTRDCLFSDVMRDGKSLLKLWNMNAMNGVVGVFHLQGSSWNRSRRRFAFHDTAPPPLKTTVKVMDVEVFREAAAGDGEADGAEGNGAERSRASTPGSEESETTHWSTGNGNGSGNGAHAADGGSDGYASDVSSESNSPARAERFRRPAQARKGCEYAAYVNTTDSLTRVPCSGGVDVSLESAQAAVVTFAPVYTYYGVDFAPIGLANMLNTGGAVVSVEVEPDWGHERVPAAVAAALRPGSDAALYEEAFSEGAAAPDAAVPRALPRFNVGVRGRGTLLALCGQEPTLCKVEGYGVPFEWRDGRLEVDVPQVGKHTLQHLTVSFR